MNERFAVWWRAVGEPAPSPSRNADYMAFIARAMRYAEARGMGVDRSAGSEMRITNHDEFTRACQTLAKEERQND